MTTINGLPSSYQGQCNVIVNDLDSLLTARNILILALASLNPDGIDTDTIIHLWYSASLTQKMYDQVIEIAYIIAAHFANFAETPPGHSLGEETPFTTIPWASPGAKSKLWLTLTLTQIREFCDLFNRERSMDLAETNRKFSMGEDCNPELNCSKDMWAGRLSGSHIFPFLASSNRRNVSRLLNHCHVLLKHPKEVANSFVSPDPACTSISREAVQRYRCSASLRCFREGVHQTKPASTSRPGTFVLRKQSQMS
jgi:hypothetical protein